MNFPHLYVGSGGSGKGADTFGKVKVSTEIKLVKVGGFLTSVLAIEMMDRGLHSVRQYTLVQSDARRTLLAVCWGSIKSGSSSAKSVDEYISCESNCTVLSF